ncbi:MAG: hypothetical protein ISQ11_07910 [Planctomycetes bacterium]|nr:hypothetical protein [Planctomycetota bacterium]
MDETTKAIIKYSAVIISLPWVLPFMKALFRDLAQAFEEDGGFLGDPPTEEQLREIRERKAGEPDPLVNEVLAHLRDRSGGNDRDAR